MFTGIVQTVGRIVSVKPSRETLPPSGPMVFAMALPSSVVGTGSVTTVHAANPTPRRSSAKTWRFMM